MCRIENHLYEGLPILYTKVRLELFMHDTDLKPYDRQCVLWLNANVFMYGQPSINAAEAFKNDANGKNRE